MNQCSTAAGVVSSVTILQAIRWIAEAWKSVSPTVIKKCLWKAGILDKEFDVIKATSVCLDRFSDLDDVELERDDSELLDVMEEIQGSDCCSYDTFVTKWIMKIHKKISFSMSMYMYVHYNNLLNQPIRPFSYVAGLMRFP